jgi:hypothetical protein
VQGNEGQHWRGGSQRRKRCFDKTWPERQKKCWMSKGEESNRELSSFFSSVKQGDVLYSLNFIQTTTFTFSFLHGVGTGHNSRQSLITQLHSGGAQLCALLRVSLLQADGVLAPQAPSFNTLIPADFSSKPSTATVGRMSFKLVPPAPSAGSGILGLWLPVNPVLILCSNFLFSHLMLHTIYTDTHRDTDTHTYRDTHIQRHAHTETHTHSYTHIQIKIDIQTYATDTDTDTRTLRQT